MQLEYVEKIKKMFKYAGFDEAEADKGFCLIKKLIKLEKHLNTLEKYTLCKKINNILSKKYQVIFLDTCLYVFNDSGVEPYYLHLHDIHNNYKDI